MKNKSKLKPSKEQKIISNLINNENNKTLKINAFAGTGKTTTLLFISNYYNSNNNFKRILYLVFNKANEIEAKQKFPKNTFVKTINSLAFNYIRNNTNINLKNVRQDYKPKEISKLYNISILEAENALNLFNNFCFSNALTFDELGDGLSTKIPKQMFGDMRSNIIDCTHNFYLKFYHLMIVHKKAPKMIYDIAFIDEAQDTNMVTLDIFLRLDIKQKVFVGDTHQQIYAFRGAKNIMDRIQVEETYLTQTFRFNNDIADIANKLLKKFKGEKHKIITNIEKNLNDLKTTCYINRTNAGLIANMNELILNKNKFVTIRNPEEIFSLVEDLFYFVHGFKSKIKKNKYLLNFKSLSELITYSKDVDDYELKSAIKIIEEYDNKIFDIKRIALRYYNNSDNIDIFLTTAHASKGLEWDKVIIEDDFQDFIKLIKEKIKLDTIQKFRKNINSLNPLVINEFNLFYVAITRAKQLLVINSINNKYIDMSNKDINILLKK